MFTTNTVLEALRITLNYSAIRNHKVLGDKSVHTLASTCRNLDLVLRHGTSDYAILRNAQLLGRTLSKDKMAVDCINLHEILKSNKDEMSKNLCSVIKHRFQSFPFHKTDKLNQDLNTAVLAPIAHWSQNQLSNRLRQVEHKLETPELHDDYKVSLNSLAKALVSLGAMTKDNARAALTKVGIIIPENQSVSQYLNTPNDCGIPPLSWATMKGHTDMVKALIQAGANLNSRNLSGDPLLHEAVFKGQTKIVLALLKAGINPNLQDKCGNNPLHLAAASWHTETAKLLLQNGADPDATNKCGKTPLHFAAYNGHTETVQALIKAGANPNTKNNNYETPLDLAEENGHTRIVDLIRATKAIVIETTVRGTQVRKKYNLHP